MPSYIKKTYFYFKNLDPYDFECKLGTCFILKAFLKKVIGIVVTLTFENLGQYSLLDNVNGFTLLHK
jgi:hypothetical protein